MRRAARFFSLLLFLHAAPATAHHSFAAEYDGKKPTTLSGTVTKVEWTNPHVHFFLDVKDPTGTTTQWEFTIGAVNGLFRRGWSKDLLKPKVSCPRPRHHRQVFASSAAAASQL
jgi:uncharacterized protein DUF6152